MKNGSIISESMVSLVKNFDEKCWYWINFCKFHNEWVNFIYPKLEKEKNVIHFIEFICPLWIIVARGLVRPFQKMTDMIIWSKGFAPLDGPLSGSSNLMKRGEVPCERIYSKAVVYVVKEESPFCNRSWLSAELKIRSCSNASRNRSLGTVEDIF